MVLVEAIPLFTYVFGFRGLVQCALVGAVLVFGFLVLARRVVTPRLRRWHQAVRILVLFAVAVISALLGTVSIYLWYAAERDVIVVIAFRCLWVFLIAMVVWAVIASSAAHSIRGQRELAATVAEIEWRVETLRGELRRVQKSSAEIVHGRVQGRIIAAALVVSMQARRLEQGESNADTGTPDALNEAAAILREASDDVRSIQAADSHEDREGCVDFFVSIGMAWQGVVDVDFGGEVLAFEAVDSRRHLRSTLAAIVREAVSNAARHGAARSITFSLNLQGDELPMTAIDDGVGLKGEPSVGLGLGQISAARGSWALKDAPAGGAELLVRLPLGA